MSDPLKVALVIEGPTDRVVIESVIPELLDGGAYITTTLQPEGSNAFGRLGAGWGGVFRWCREAAESGGGSLSGEVLFENYDVLVIHLDADVAGKHYNDYGFPSGFDDLPCEEPCPPASATTDALRRVLLNWAGETQVPLRTVLCIPSKSTEAWVLAALFPATKRC
jgi:hypothetical protein